MMIANKNILYKNNDKYNIDDIIQIYDLYLDHNINQEIKYNNKHNNKYDDKNNINIYKFQADEYEYYIYYRKYNDKYIFIKYSGVADFDKKYNKYIESYVYTIGIYKINGDYIYYDHIVDDYEDINNQIFK
jgi:hypothetical protein